MTRVSVRSSALPTPGADVVPIVMFTDVDGLRWRRAAGDNRFGSWRREVGPGAAARQVATTLNRRGQSDSGRTLTTVGYGSGGRRNSPADARVPCVADAAGITRPSYGTFWTPTPATASA